MSKMSGAGGRAGATEGVKVTPVARRYLSLLSSAVFVVVYPPLARVVIVVFADCGCA